MGMTRLRMTALATAVVLAAFATQAYAHHAFKSEYDWKKPATLQGTVTKVEWVSPHAMIHLATKNASGASEEWTIELGSPNLLQKDYRWVKDSIKVNDMVTVDGWKAIDDSKKMLNAMTVTLPNGRELFAGSSFFDEFSGPPRRKTSE
jgi:hypothetical protein